MAQHRLRAAFMRGGTSKAIMFRAEDLPARREDWAPIFLAAMGSPDPSGRQLNGMGGGVSSLSKICIIGPPSRPDADVDYTFAQISIKESTVDYSGNCGNMSSAIGPFAVDEGLVPLPAGEDAAVRIHNTNTSKIIVSRFKVRDGQAVTEGDLRIDGVAGTAAPIRLEFTDPGGTKTRSLLPTGRSVDRLEIAGVGTVEASLVDAANPCVFVAASTVGKTGSELPDALDADPDFLALMEKIRCAASVAMGMAPDLAAAAAIPSIPKIAMVTAPGSVPTLSGQALEPADMDIVIRMISVGQPHRAVPVTGATCLAVAARVPGSIPNQVARSTGAEALRIAHPSGVVLVDAEVEPASDGTLRAVHGAIYRTARRLFDGYVYYPSKAA
jgi:2-methylaconitate cis-trans-isomerase PrpF